MSSHSQSHASNRNSRSWCLYFKFYKKAVLSQRWPRDAPYVGTLEDFRDSLTIVTTPRATRSTGAPWYTIRQLVTYKIKKWEIKIGEPLTTPSLPSNFLKMDPANAPVKSKYEIIGVAKKFGKSLDMPTFVIPPLNRIGLPCRLFLYACVLVSCKFWLEFWVGCEPRGRGL